MSTRSAGMMLARWLWLLVVAALAGEAQAAPQGARAVLADEAFGFCHDERYPLTEGEARWCTLLPEVDPPCPAFRSACTAPRAASGPGGPQWRRTAGQDDGSDDAQRARGPVEFDRQHEATPRPEAELEGDPSLGLLAHVLVWVIVAIMVLALLAQLRGPAGPRAPQRAQGEPDPEPEPEADATPLPAETDVDRLLARAIVRAERGELDAAVTDGHAALLRRLAERGHIRLHPSRTNGDHVRDLRGTPKLHQPTREVVRLVERVQFGHAPISRADVDRLLTQVRAVLSAVAGVVLLLWTSLACTSDQPHHYPWSHSPSGTAGVLALLRGEGLEVEYRTRMLDAEPKGGPQASKPSTPIVLDRANLSDGEWSALLSHVRRGGHAVVATSERLPDVVGVGRADRGGTTLQPGPERWWDEAPTVVVPGRAGLSWSGQEGQVLWTDDRSTVYALVRHLGDGSVVVLADDLLLTNAALAVPDNGVALVELLRELGPRLELIDGGVRSKISPSAARDPFEAMARAHLTPAIVQLLLLVLLLYLWRGVHFGRPRDPPPPSRRRFAEHVEALAQHYQRAGARRHALRLYAGWALERVHERFGGRRRGLHHLARRIAARTGRDETETMRILTEAHDARDDDIDGKGGEEDLRVLRELGRLIDTTRGPTTRGPS